MAHKINIPQRVVLSVVLMVFGNEEDDLTDEYAQEANGLLNLIIEEK